MEVKASIFIGLAGYSEAADVDCTPAASRSIPQIPHEQTSRASTTSSCATLSRPPVSVTSIGYLTVDNDISSEVAEKLINSL